MEIEEEIAVLELELLFRCNQNIMKAKFRFGESAYNIAMGVPGPKPAAPVPTRPLANLDPAPSPVPS